MKKYILYTIIPPASLIFLSYFIAMIEHQWFEFNIFLLFIHSFFITYGTLFIIPIYLVIISIVFNIRYRVKKYKEIICCGAIIIINAILINPKSLLKYFGVISFENNDLDLLPVYIVIPGFIIIVGFCLLYVFEFICRLRNKR